MNLPMNIEAVRLETPRLILRPFEEKDLQDFYAYASVPGVGEMAGWPHHESMETSRLVLAGFIEKKEVFALEDKETGRVIGSLGVHKGHMADEWAEYSSLKARTLGYVLSKDHWGKGLMPEAVNCVLRWLFEEKGAEAVCIAHFTCNDRSRRVIEKCGFRFVDRALIHAKQMNREFEDMRYICLREEFLPGRRNI